jgi:hypothetical protein
MRRNVGGPQSEKAFNRSKLRQQRKEEYKNDRKMW